MRSFDIGWLFPDTLFLHGDRGNVLALARYAQALGFDHEISKIDFETKDLKLSEHDVLFAAPGEISVFPAVRDFLMPHKEELEQYIEAGHPLIVTGTSIGLFCEKIIRADGTELDGLGILHAAMFERDYVYGDDIYYKCTYNGKEMEVIGSIISMADLDLEDEKPFGELLYGYGNTGKDKGEGIAKANAVFTNALGPVLVTNPWLTVEIIKAAAAASGKEVADKPVDFTLEEKSFELKKKFELTKQTTLTNVQR